MFIIRKYDFNTFIRNTTNLIWSKVVKVICSQTERQQILLILVSGVKGTFSQTKLLQCTFYISSKNQI